MRPWENFVRAMLAGIALAGCKTDESPSEDVGQVELTIVAVDGEGNTWRLPPATSLFVSRGSFQDQLPLDGDTQVQTFSLPVGAYDWELTNIGLTGPEWPLERTDPQNNVETVWATLLTPQPGDFTLQPNETVSLPLSFQAATGGSVTFAKGTVDVTVDVESTEVLGGDFQWGQVVETTSVNVNPETSAELVSRLPSVGTTGDITLLGHISGAWDMTSSDTVCAPIELDALGASPAGLHDLLLETVTSQTGQICLATSGFTEISMWSTQQPITDTFDDLGISLMSFAFDVSGTLPTPAFDGTTVDLSALAGAYTPDGVFHQSAYDFSTGGSWSSLSVGQVYFSFAPAPVP